MSEASAGDIPQLTLVLQDQSKDQAARDSAASALLSIAQQTPDYRGQCIAILASTLERYQRNPIELNTSLINHLITLKAAESAALVQQVVKAGEYDRAIGDWGRISRQLGVAEKPPAAIAPSKQATPPADAPATTSFINPTDFSPPDPASAAATIASRPHLTPKEKDKLRSKRKQERKARKQNRRR
jgi:hypothetical protein